MAKTLLLKDNEPERSAAHKQPYRLPKKKKNQKNYYIGKVANKKIDTLCTNSA